MCPACNCRCDDIFDLADHLGRECKEKEVEPISQVNIKREAHLELPSPNETDSNELINPKVEMEDNGYDKSILEKALTSSDEHENLQNDNESEESKVVYMCQMCNINFISIEEHLQKFHEGEEVIYVIHLIF